VVVVVDDDAIAKAILKNVTFAFMSGRLRKFNARSGASIHSRNTHNLSKNIIYFVVVPLCMQASKQAGMIKTQS